MLEGQREDGWIKSRIDEQWYQGMDVGINLTELVDS